MYNICIMKIQNLVGEKYGKLTVLEYVGCIKKSSRAYYKCKCDCGNFHTTRADCLLNGKNPQCTDCFRGIFIGKKQGKITVIERLDKVDKSGRPYWKYRCECGVEKVVLSATIFKTKNCFACREWKIPTSFNNKGFRGYGEISRTYWNSIYNGAIARNIEFNVSIEYAWHLFLEQNRKCALSGEILIFHNRNDNRKIKTASLDRIDSSKGYQEENIQWVHKDINKIKWGLSQENFISLCEKVYKHSLNKEKDNSILHA